MNKVLNIGALVLDQKLQSRTEINEDTVADYVEAVKRGDEFPPVLAYFDGVHYWLTDGYHRYHAHKQAGRAGIDCEVVNGTFRDAVLRATSVNSKHGMRRTYADKRKAVMTLIDDIEWDTWSNIEMAEHCGVSASFVSNLRSESGKKSDVVTYKTPTGKVMTKAKAPGRAAKEPELKEPAPEPKVEEYDARDELIAHLTKENDELTMNLALAHLGGTEAEQAEARETMNAVHEELRVLKIELAAVKQSRDAFQFENQQLKAQCASYQRQLKKLQP
jgi:hypothetical protein